MSKDYYTQNIVPAVIPDSSHHLESLVHDLHFSHQLHVDIVDGRFVPSISWPYTNTSPVAEVAQILKKHSIEVDLMVTDPIEQATSWVDLGVDMLVFHVETISLAEFRQVVDSFHECSIGISALNDTSFETLQKYLEYADYVQIMGIAKIGAQGAAFDRRLFERIRQVKKHVPELMISVDGSVNESTIEEISAAGVDRCIVGSAIVAAEDKEAAYTTLLARTSTQ